MLTFLEIQEQFKEFDLEYRFYDTEQEALKFLLQTVILVCSTNIMASDKVFVLERR
jgi:predicted nuclease of restriction endonuclease-like (RecB) superfamily